VIVALVYDCDVDRLLRELLSRSKAAEAGSDDYDARARFEAIYRFHLIAATRSTPSRPLTPHFEDWENLHKLLQRPEIAHHCWNEL